MVDAREASGITFVHHAARTPEKHLPETMGAGVALLDVDGDGDLDAYFVQSGAIRAGAAAGSRADELWLNDGRMRFSRSGALAPDDAVGQGACAGDVDGDGDEDLLVTNVGRSRLLVNDGGRLRPSDTSALDAATWATSCTFLDADGDGDLDAFIASYVDWDADSKNPVCGDAGGPRIYCHPDAFRGLPPRLLLGDGRGGFREAASERGMGRADGKGLGVLLVDPDGDADADLYVANDGTPNFLWRNDGAGRFTEIGLAAGVAVDEQGRPQGSMGVASGDVDGDGCDDLLVTNLDFEGATLYACAGRPLAFRDASARAGLEEPTLPLVGFGIELKDFDFDGDLDALVTNGHVVDDIQRMSSSRRHAQPLQLFAGDGAGRFRLVGPDAFPPGASAVVGRGLATGDLDGDGDLDAIVTTNGGAPLVLRNEGAEARPHVVVALTGTKANRDALGARLTIRSSGASTVLARALVQGGRSYLSDGSRAVHVAVPSGVASVDVEVVWPGGAIEAWSRLAVGGTHRLVQGAHSVAKSGAP